MEKVNCTKKEECNLKFFRDLQRYAKYTIYSARATLRTEVVNSYLDWFWWILEPFCTMIIYTIIFGYVFDAAEKYFPIFLFVGITMWGFFNKTILKSIHLVRSNRSVISRIYVPKYILVIETILVNGFKMMLSFLIVIIMMIVNKVSISFYVFEIIPIIFVLVLFTFGCSCILLHCGVYVDDLSYIVSILMTMLMYFTGVFYSLSKRVPEPFGRILETCNPVAFLISAARNVLLYEQGIYSSIFIGWTIVSILLSIFGIRLIIRNENNYIKVI